MIRRGPERTPGMALDDLDPFDIFDAEATRLDRFFDALDEKDWDRPSRCAGWSVRDVLAHLAGEEAYNHACLDDELDELFGHLAKAGVGDFAEFNDWTVRARRDLPVARVLQEWRTENEETRRRMRALGRDATLATSVGPYPVGLQTFHYCSEFATHADDVGVPGADEPGRVGWRARVGLFALAERGSPAEVEHNGDYAVRVPGAQARLTPAEFVEATVARLPDDHPLDPRLRDALRCLA
jgi:uncharacterized protein (TIGR03083 family)